MDKIKFAQQYKSEKSYPFPSEDIDQNLKNSPDYFRASANAILCKFFTNKCAVPYDSWGEDENNFQELRAYRKGTNSPNKYKDLYLGKDKLGVRNKTTVNISWRILQILPQKIDVVKGYLQKIDYDVDISATDYQSLVDKKTMISMAKILADPIMQGINQDINQTAGRPVITPQDTNSLPGKMQFTDPEQVDVAAQVGIFFLEEEAALQNLLDKTQIESSSDIISDLIKEDLLTTGYGGKRVYTNPNTNIVMEDYVDVDRAIFPDSIYTDYHDITYAAEIKRYSIARLLQETEISDIQAIEIAKKYSSTNGVGTENNFYGQAQQYKTNGTFGMNMYHQIEVDVIDCKWIGKKNVNITSVQRDKEKNMVVNLVDDAYDLSKVKRNKGKTLDKYSHMTVYKCKMVLGTNFVFDFGEDNDISFNKDSSNKLSPILPYRFVRTGTSSLVSRCIGFVDDACLANYKLRVARSKMPAPPYIQIDKSALEGMQIDGVRYKPAELMRLLSDEGFLITDSKNQWGNGQNNGRAISPIGSDMFQVLSSWWDDMGKSIEMIERVTGINDVFAAQTPKGDGPGLGVSNILIAGAQNALTPIIKASEYITEQPWRVAAKKWQIVATYLPEEQKKQLSINRSLQIVKIGSKMAERDFDLKITATDSTQEIQQMLADLQNMKSASRQGGQQSLNESDYLILNSLLKSKKLKQAQLYCAFAIQKKEAQNKADAQEAIQSNGQQQQQSLQAKAQADQQNMQLQGQVDSGTDATKIKLQSQADIQLEVIKGQNQMNAIKLQSALSSKTA